MGVGPPLRALALTTAALVPLGALIVWVAHAPWAALSTPAGVAATGTHEIAVRAHAWGFSPRVVRVSPGETVRFIASSEDMRHGFAINELGVNLGLLPGQEVRSAAVDVNLPEGTYVIHCSVFCGLGHPSMKAKLIVGTPTPAPGSALPWGASLAAAALVAGFTLATSARRRRG